MGNKTGRKLLVVVATVVALVAASIPSFSCQPAPPKTVTLKIDTFFIEPTHFSQSVKYWAESVEEKTGGRITFEIYYAEQLVAPPDQWDAAAEGIVDVTDVATSYVSAKVSDLAPIEVPALDWENYRKSRAEVMPILDEICAQHGLKPLFELCLGEGAFIHRSHLVTTPGALKGEMYRAAGRWQNRWMELLGASPTFIASPELYEAIQRGTVEGGFIITLMLPALKLDEVAPYLTILGAPPPNRMVLVMNLNSWNSLSKKDQEIILEVAKDAEGFSWDLATEFDIKIMEEMKAKGRHVHVLTPAERAQIYKVGSPMWDEVREASGPLGDRLADILEKYKPY